ncbi:MAG: hypothetical protein ACKOXF_01225 [Chitinophagaceae bacterium]
MKTIFTVMMSVLLLTELHAQERMHYQDVVLKTNVLNPFSIGIEAPFKENFTVEYSIRRAHTFIFNKNTFKDERLNVKYHIPFTGLLDLKRSAYFMLGVHSKYQELHNTINRTGAREYGVLDQNRFVYGIGMRSRYIDVWLAAERVFFERTNVYTYTDANGMVGPETLWKNGRSISMGLSINLVNFRNLHWNSR